jgi:hypothetical protein
MPVPAATRRIPKGRAARFLLAGRGPLMSVAAAAAGAESTSGRAWASMAHSWTKLTEAMRGLCHYAVTTNSVSFLRA